MKRSAKPIIAAMILLLLAGTGWRLYTTFGGSSEGTVAAGAPMAEPEKNETRQVIDGSYAQFSYGYDLQLVNAEQPSAPVLANYNFQKQQFSSWRAAVQITSLPTGRLQDSGTYNFRDANPDRYKKSSQQIGPHAVVSFTDQTDGAFNKIAYIHSGSKIASILLAGGTPDQVDAMQTELAAIIASWQWR